MASPLVDAAHPHGHSHGHDHAPGHAHDHDHPHSHDHAHPQGHTHDHEHAHDHDHGHDHDHAHSHDHAHPHPGGSREVAVHQSIFAANDRMAERNRGFFKALGLLTLNVVSSPGSGKTALLQKTIERLQPATRVGVIVGDLETDNDARRLRTTGAPVVQISTGTLCHLDAEMIARAVGQIDAKALDILIVENVGNLVCPAEFDLGEDVRVALLSVTEGEDKPLKYPPMFRNAHVVLVTKTDLAPHVDFNRDAALENIRRVSPRATIFELSSKDGSGMDAWCDYLRSQRGRFGSVASASITLDNNRVDDAR
jgi:hydrogenase nickel incorporation protein HypB